MRMAVVGFERTVCRIDIAQVTDDYRALRAWQRAMDLAEECYRLCRRLPEQERYGLSMQIRRAAASIPANLAEGNSRYHRAEYVQFVNIARGSAAELRTHLELVRRLGLLPAPDLRYAMREVDRVCGLLTALREALRQ